MSHGLHYLSDDLVEKISAFKHLLSFPTWESFSDAQKSQLFEFLPKSLTQSEKITTVKLLFSGGNLTAFSSACCSSSSGSPIDEICNRFEKGFYSDEARFFRTCQNKAITARNNYVKSHYYNEVLKEVVVSQKCHLSAITFPQCFESVRHQELSNAQDELSVISAIKQSARDLYTRTLQNIRQDVLSNHGYSNEDLFSSDTDSDIEQDIETSRGHLTEQTSVVSQNRVNDLLVQHKRRRAAGVDTPDLITNNIKLIDVCNRVYGNSKKGGGFLRKRRRPDNSSYSRAKKFKSSRLNKDIKKEKKHLIIREKKPLTSPSCYFELFRDVIKLSSEKSTSSIQLLVCDWLASAEASRYDWTNNFGSGDDLIRSGLEFLNRTPVEENNESPLLKYDNDAWVWLSSLPQDEEVRVLQRLCGEWMDEIPAELLRSNMALSEGDNIFHHQERRRFSYAHQAFVYNINGSRYPVPPVKGTVGPIKEGKVAREHCLLKSERPPQVTLLALTRDAVARLPEGRGTRSVICNLVRDSQYLAPEISDAQITAAVSGALDRLHYELDPCVRYDVSAKAWLYLHADRSAEDLERIHAEQLGVPKKKKERVAKKSRNKPVDSKKKHKEKNVMPAVETDGSKENSSIQDESHKSANPLLKQGPPDVTLESKKAAPSKPSGTRTIQVSQKQLLEMTRSIMRHGTAGDARELLINHVDKKLEGKPPDVSSGQPGLKLILKPSLNNPQKPVAELVRVLEPSPRNNQHVLSSSALRRLTEQLSAMSSRPIKIIQRNVAPPPRIVNVNPQQTVIKNKLLATHSNTAVLAPSSVSIPRTVPPPDGVQRSPKTVYISRVAKSESMPSKSGDETRVLHIVHRGPHNTTRTIEVGSSASKPNTNIQLASNTPKSSVRIFPDGKTSIFRPSGGVGSISSDTGAKASNDD